MGTTSQNNSPENTLAGTKRKRNGEQKFYAVRVGNTPGVYHSWSDCLEQVKGFKNATFKSFATLTDAESFVANGPTPRSTTSLTNSKYYGVQSGRIPGVYTSWPEAQEQISGWSKPKFKSFATRAEAEAFVRASDAPAGDGDDAIDHDSTATKRGTSTKKVKKTNTTITDDSDFNYPPGEGPLPPDSVDGMDTRLLLNASTGNVEYKTAAQYTATKQYAIGPSSASTELRIYTDGAARGNGTADSIAGIGVYFGPQDPRNISEPLAGARQTNQRAELTAIQRALDMAPRDRQVTIYSDSNYAIKCVTEWFLSWRRNGWLTASKKAVENRDLVEAILTRIEEREALGSRTKFQWLKGHDGDPGNVAADELAVRGAEEARLFS